MDPITAFGLAANIVQVVDMSTKALLKCRELYQDGSLAEHRSIDEVTQYLGQDPQMRLHAPSVG